MSEEVDSHPRATRPESPSSTGPQPLRMATAVSSTSLAGQTGVVRHRPTASRDAHKPSLPAIDTGPSPLDAFTARSLKVGESGVPSAASSGRALLHISPVGGQSTPGSDMMISTPMGSGPIMPNSARRSSGSSAATDGVHWPATDTDSYLRAGAVGSMVRMWLLWAVFYACARFRRVPASAVCVGSPAPATPRP